MIKTLFDYLDYKTYLAEFIRTQPMKGRGFKAKLAQAMKCQSAYLSRVLNGNAHLSLEQAQMASMLIGHTKEEQKFFLLLVLHTRAGTRELRDEFHQQIEQTLQQRLNLKNRFNVKKTLSREDQMTYYSAWYYSAIHFLLTISEYQTREAIAQRLKLPLKKVSSILDFLVSIGLAAREGNHFKTGVSRIHLENDSPMISKHHSNWRMKAIQSVDQEEIDEMHYSAVVTIAKKDAVKIKSALIEAVERVRLMVKESKEEELFCYNVDFFKV